MKRNKQKAITLPEVVITLSLLTIVLVLVTSLVLAVSNVSKRQTYNQNCQTDYQKAVNFVDGFVQNYSTYHFELDVLNTDAQCVIRFANGGETYSLIYEKQSNKLIAQMLDFGTNEVKNVENSFKYINNITFSKQSNLIKCEYYFENYPTFTNLVVFGS